MRRSIESGRFVCRARRFTPGPAQLYKKSGGPFSRTARNYFLVEERQRMGATFLRRAKKGLFTFTMMMKTVRMIKSLVIEIRTFCIKFCQQDLYQTVHLLIRSNLCRNPSTFQEFQRSFDCLVSNIGTPDCLLQWDILAARCCPAATCNNIKTPATPAVPESAPTSGQNSPAGGKFPPTGRMGGRRRAFPTPGSWP